MAVTTPAGVLCAALLHTRDVAASARHYEAVFGWAAVPDAAGTSFMLDGQRVAAASGVVAGVNGWVPYVGAEDVGAGAALAARSGGSVLDGGAEPSPENGRRMVKDSGRRRARPLRPRRRRGRGAHRRAGVGVVDRGAQPHACESPRFLRRAAAVAVHRDAAAAARLVSRRPARGTAAGGILPIGKGWGTSPRWQLLFRVDDLVRSTQQVVDAGGRVEFGPLDVPSAGVTTSVRDSGTAPSTC